MCESLQSIFFLSLEKWFRLSQSPGKRILTILTCALIIHELPGGIQCGQSKPWTSLSPWTMKTVGWKQVGWLVGVVLAQSWTEPMERRVTGSVNIYDNPGTKYSVWLSQVLSRSTWNEWTHEGNHWDEEKQMHKRYKLKGRWGTVFKGWSEAALPPGRVEPLSSQLRVATDKSNK